MGLVLFIIVAYLILGTKKGRNILVKVFSKLAKSSLKVIVYILIAALLIYIAVNIVIWVVQNIVLSLIIVLLAFAAIVALGAYQNNKQKKAHMQLVEEWKKKPIKNFTDHDIYKMIVPYGNTFYDNDTNTTKYKSDFPYGRITYFLNFFEHDIQFEDPLFFSPIRSTNQNELREYGTVLTTGGLYISSQQTKTNKDGTSVSKDIEVPLSGMVSSKISNDSLQIDYVNFAGRVTIYQKYTTVPIAEIHKFCEMVITSGISISLYNGAVYDYTAILDEQEERFLKQNVVSGVEKGITAAGIASSIPNMNSTYNNVKYNMDQKQGHGTAAEYGNTAIDKILGDFSAKHIGGDNALNGADRISHGTPLQSKYCSSPSATINEAFGKNHNYDYSKMKIEVPRDQYTEAIVTLQKKINNGELENKGIPRDANAEDYLRKGHLTYQQALNVAKSGSIESLAIDALQGISCSAAAGSITALITFANCIWSGMEVKDAAKKSLEIGAKTIGKSAFVFVITMQLSRKNFINYLSSEISTNGKTKIYGSITNPVYKLGDNLAKKISSSALAKSTIGQKLGLVKISGRTIISGGITAVITFGPDIARALAGRISFKQLMKNSAIGASGLAGAAVGQVLIPVPVVGAMVGGAVSSFIVKKTLDHFIEDDAIEMFHILKEEFIDLVTVSGLKQDEFNEVVNLTIAHKKLPSLLRDMYAFGDSRQYAREEIISVALQYVFSKRKQITEYMYIEGMAQLVEEPVT